MLHVAIDGVACAPVVKKKRKAVDLRPVTVRGAYKNKNENKIYGSFFLIFKTYRIESCSSESCRERPH